jgi:tetratricopeptide (TPR) repeat protein
MTPPDTLHDLLRRAEALLNAARPAEAEAVLRQVLLRDPKHAEALNALGAIALGRGENKAAIALFERAIGANARAPILYANAAEAQRRAGAAEKAIAHAEAALRLKPDHSGALSTLAHAQTERGEDEAALKTYDRLIALDPKSAAIHARRAQVLRRLGRLPEAADGVREALSRDSSDAEIMVLAGGIEIDRGAPAIALDWANKALARAPDMAEALTLKGRALYDSGAIAEAADIYAQAMARKQSLEAGIGLGNALKDLGRFAEAEAAFDACRAIAPDHFLAYVNLVEVKTFREDSDSHVRDMEAALKRVRGLPEEQQIYLHFALAKALDDLGRFDEAGEQMLRGNALKRKATHYSEPDTLGLFERIRTTFGAETLQAPPSTREESPIFVFGMPRSGTTLAEQIIASHPEVTGAGETDHMNDAVMHAAQKLGFAFPEAIGAMGPAALTDLGADYLGRIALPNARRTTDKAPYNFLFAGAIHLALPRAKMIHTIRDPLDTCVSGFSKLFARGNTQSYDLAELGRYYRAYHELMQHWRTVLPAGVILDVRYEDMVSNLEREARRILEFCGLEWDPRVLEFHKTDRTVKTWSAQQVRQPIYASSIGRWRHYETKIGPLIEALGDLAVR